MFHSKLDCIEQTYDKQDKNIAYTVTTRDLDPEHSDLQYENLHDRLHQ
jgi:hypothetical protein